jgi:hypothetical protein
LFEGANLEISRKLHLHLSGSRKAEPKKPTAKSFMSCGYAIKDQDKREAGQDLSTLVWRYVNREHDFCKPSPGDGNACFSGRSDGTD